uniref:Exocyst subunit Exo70 family protein n=1 Tax=Leersia perrieri TaxID=77586 RepID=A0A0D9V9N3_9ORYZ
MAASPISSGASFVFPTSAVESSTSASASSNVGSEEIDPNTCKNISQMISSIRGGDHKAAASQWHMAQREIDVMVQEIHSKAGTQQMLVWSYKLRLLAFADEITKLQLSPDKLFVVLRLLKVLNPDYFLVSQCRPEEFSTAKYDETLQRLRMAVYHMLHELKILVQTRASRCVPQGGGVHEVTRYVMNYIRLLLHHKSTLNLILTNDDSNKDERMHSLDHIVQDLMICLESMLNKASEAYDPQGLRYFFLMNNLHFAVKQVEGTELISHLGQSWVQVHRQFIEQYMKTYVDLSWGPALSCLSARKGMLGGCFSQPSSTVRFSLQFDSTYYNQECWKVEDPQLREKVRRAVCDKVILAYQPHYDKYTKAKRKHEWYTPELLKAQLMKLFEGRTE